MRLAVCQGFQTGIRDLFESNPRFGELLVCQSATNRKELLYNRRVRGKLRIGGCGKRLSQFQDCARIKKDRLRPKERKDEEGGG